MSELIEWLAQAYSSSVFGIRGSAIMAVKSFAYSVGCCLAITSRLRVGGLLGSGPVEATTGPGDRHDAGQDFL